MASEFRIIKGLEWCVEIPTRCCPRESPVFLVEDKECLFRFALEEQSERWYFNFYLKIRSNDTELEPFTGKLQVGFKKEQALSLGKINFTISNPGSTEIWYISQNTLQSDLPSDYKDGNWIKFLLFFDDIAGPVLKINEELDGKYVQTPSYIDTNILLEGVSKDFSTLLDEGPNHDVEFICGDETIKAHKNVLCCRSEVFASMLRTDMVEGKTGQVKIQDMDGAIFKQFLRYLYTGVLPYLTVDTAFRFYDASDKYAIDALKKQCTSFLLENLSRENACELLIIADRHNDSDFKKSVMEYMIKEKIPRIGEKRTDFCKDNLALAVEVLNLFVQHFP